MKRPSYPRGVIQMIGKQTRVIPRPDDRCVFVGE